MQKHPGSGLPGAARIALVAAWALIAGLSCSKSTQPIPRADGGVGSDGGNDVARDLPATASDGGNGSDATPGQLGEGRPCAGNNQCASGFCTDGVCCQTACTDTCWTCSAQGSVGICIPADVGSDPHGDCPDDGLASCGRDGTCDGSGACRRYPTGTTCRPITCSGSTLTLASRCEAGVCKPTTGLPCDPYVCDSHAGNVCLKVCVTNDDCGPGNICNGGSCGKKPLGAPCAQGDDCNSAICQQGVCCRETCAGNCMSCAVPQIEGACTPVPAGTDPLGQCADSGRTTCGTDGFCDGQGVCEIYSKATVCRDATCAVGFSTGIAPGHCDGAGTCNQGGPVSCNAYTCGATGACLVSCRDSADCAGGNVCNGTVCGRKVQGASCALGNECASGTCQQGVCCDMVCTGTCMACNQAGSMGRCLTLPFGPAPAGQCTAAAASTCGNDGNCDGAGRCHLFASGTVCKSPTCATATQTVAGRCNGVGVCVNGTTQLCAPYQCGPGSACLSVCNAANGNADCTAGNTCTAASCGKKPLGAVCTLASDCGSTLCEQGVCCDMACAGTCRSCALAGSAGKCLNVPAGQDPLDQCPIDAPSTCKRDGSCDGAGACHNYSLGTPCVVGSCAGATLTLPRTCDGAGTCQTSPSADCPGSFTCDAAGVGCKTSCAPAATPSECVAPTSCSGSACVLKGNGAACGLANECASGFCEQGVCCGSSCTATCKSCALPGATLGTCSNIVLGQKDLLDRCPTTAVLGCGTDGTCDGAGACHNFSAGTQCVAGSCPTGSAVQTPPRLCDGVGHCATVNTARCDPFLCDGNLACKTSCTLATTTADCLAPGSCKGVTCGNKSNGATCSIGDDCNSAVCAQGVCCDRDCSGTCQSCALDGKVGVCSLVPAGGAPAVASQCAAQGILSCGNDGTCNGSGACRLFASGTVCVAGTCSTGATQVLPRLCNGTGTCQASTIGICAGGFNCDTGASVCRTSCTIPTQAADCTSPNVCTGNICGVLSLQYLCADTNARTISPHPQFRIINLGSAAVPLSDLTIRYWFTGDGAQTYAGVIDFAANSANAHIQGNMSASFIAVTRSGADQYMQLAFNGGAGTLAAGGGTALVQSRLNSTNPAFGVSFTQTGDYSFDATKTALTDWTHVTLYQRGVLVWGIEPP
jgi:Cellulose binding domain